MLVDNKGYRFFKRINLSACIRLGKNWHNSTSDRRSWEAIPFMAMWFEILRSQADKSALVETVPLRALHYVTDGRAMLYPLTTHWLYLSTAWAPKSCFGGYMNGPTTKDVACRIPPPGNAAPASRFLCESIHITKTFLEHKNNKQHPSNLFSVTKERRPLNISGNSSVLPANKFPGASFPSCWLLFKQTLFLPWIQVHFV